MAVIPISFLGFPGKEVTLAQLAPASDDFHSPSCRDPKKIMLELKGSTLNLSPTSRRSSLPPIFRSMLNLVQVSPLSMDLKIVPRCGHQSAVNLTAAM